MSLTLNFDPLQKVFDTFTEVVWGSVFIAVQWKDPHLLGPESTLPPLVRYGTVVRGLVWGGCKHTCIRPTPFPPSRIEQFSKYIPLRAGEAGPVAADRPLLPDADAGARPKVGRFTLRARRHGEDWVREGLGRPVGTVCPRLQLRRSLWLSGMQMNPIETSRILLLC